MNEQLEYWKESGELWGEVARLLEGGLTGDGALVRGCELEELLKNAESWKGMSAAQRDAWAKELILSTNQAGAYIISMGNGINELGGTIEILLSNIANDFPSSVFICLSSSKSILFPIKITFVSGLEFVLNSFNHISIFLKDSLELIA